MPATKVRTRAVVPAEMRRAFREVLQVLKHKQREGESIGHGDALQSDCLCGGLTADEPRPFEFTYYAPSGARWYLRLAKIQLRDIAQGHLKELLLYRCDNQDCQAHFASPDETCVDCDVSPRSDA